MSDKDSPEVKNPRANVRLEPMATKPKVEDPANNNESNENLVNKDNIPSKVKMTE